MRQRTAQAQEIAVGLHDPAGRSGWARVLEQEGLPHVRTSEPDQPITVSEGPLPPWAERYVSGGGVLVASGVAPADGLLPPGELATIQRVAPPGREHPAATPCLAWLYRGEGEGRGEVRLHEDRITKGGIVQDRYPLVSRQRIGRGWLVYTGVPLTELLQAAGDRLRRFCEFTDVTERVASVDKAEVVDVLVGMLRWGFHALGMPYVSLCRFPSGASSVLILRVDVDGAFGDRARQLAAVAHAHGVDASFFLNASKCEEHPGELQDWPGDHEIGHHGYVHNVFDQEPDNRTNLERGKAWATAVTGRAAESFVAPRGLWNQALDRALASGGYAYSSDFSIDFDSLPFRTPAGVLQVPVHPYSPERAAVHAAEKGAAAPTADEVSDHFCRVIERQAARGRPAHVYGHPEVLGAMADEVLPRMFATARALGLPHQTLGGFAAWWSEREKAGMRLRWDADRGRMDAEFDSGGPWSVRVSEPGRRERVTSPVDDGSTTSVPPS